MPYTKVKAQVEPQSIPAGFDATVPRPVLPAVSVRTPWKVAVTVFAASIATEQVVAVTGVQFSDHPRNLEPDAAVAVRVTEVPRPNDRVQVLPHEMPVGFDVTVPDPVFRSDLETVRETAGRNVAVTLRATVIARVQVPVAFVQAPDHPVKTDPDAAVAVRTTDVPKAYDALQVAPQEIPDGEEETVPEPEPAFVTARPWVPHRATRLAASRRPPLTVIPASEAVAAVEARSAERRAEPPAAGATDAQRAMAPVTCGAAIEVPLARA